MGPMPIVLENSGRIDVMKRRAAHRGRAQRRWHKATPETHVILPHGQVVKIETIKRGRLFVDGRRVEMPDESR